MNSSELGQQQNVFLDTFKKNPLKHMLYLEYYISC